MAKKKHKRHVKPQAPQPQNEMSEKAMILSGGVKSEVISEPAKETEPAAEEKVSKKSSGKLGHLFSGTVEDKRVDIKPQVKESTRQFLRTVHEETGLTYGEIIDKLVEDYQETIQAD